MNRLFLLLTLLLIAPALTAAQDDTGWPVIERCVGEPTAPPEGWTFDGTIFTEDFPMFYLEDIGGFHAIRNDVSTPYFIAFNGRDIVAGGRLSPDGRWYAVPAGRNPTSSQVLGMASSGWITEAIHIYSTDPSRQRISLVVDPEPGSYSIQGWIDNENFIYGGYSLFTGEFDAFLVNPFTRNVTPFDGPLPDNNPPQTFIETLKNVLGSSYEVVGKIDIAPNTQTAAIRVHKKEEPELRKFLIVDLEAMTITDSCIPVSGIYGFSWSPDSSQLALSQDGWIRIFDTETWNLYNIFQHDSHVIDWLEGW